MKYKIHSVYLYLEGLQLSIALHSATVNLAFHLRGEGLEVGPKEPGGVAFTWNGAIMDLRSQEDQPHPFGEYGIRLIIRALWSPWLMTGWLRGKNGKSKVSEVPYARACTWHLHPSSIISRTWTVTPPCLWTMAVETRLELRWVLLKDLKMLQVFPTPGTREVNRAGQPKDAPHLWDVNPPQPGH